jgi:predicted tellurium resistance membrane protein TerC
MTVFFLWLKWIMLRKQIFSKYIAKLKIKEEKEELERRAERNKGFDTGDYNAILFLPTAQILLKILESPPKAFISAIPEL